MTKRKPKQWRQRIEKAKKAPRASKGSRGRFYFQGFKSEEQMDYFQAEKLLEEKDSEININVKSKDSYTYDDYRQIEREATSRLQQLKKNKGKSKKY